MPNHRHLIVDAERAIARKTIECLLAAGYEVTVFDGDEDALERSISKRSIYRAMFSTGGDYLMAFKPGDEDRSGWVRFVYGNDGWDVMSDYTVNLEATIKPANDLATRWEQRINN